MTTIFNVNDMHDFAEAIGYLLYFPEGTSMAREGWNGKGMSVAVQLPDALSKMSQPYLYIRTADGNTVPWVPSQADMFTADWVLTDEELP